MGERFETTIALGGKTATMFEVPLDVRAVFGRARPPVRVTINGHAYRSTVAAYGDRYYIPLNRGNREAAGVEAGDVVAVTLEPDLEPRRVEVPEDLAGALAAAPSARANFETMSFSHQREYVDWISEAKRADTRSRRIRSAIERLTDGKTQR